MVTCLCLVLSHGKVHLNRSAKNVVSFRPILFSAVIFAVILSHQTVLFTLFLVFVDLVSPSLEDIDQYYFCCPASCLTVLRIFLFLDVAVYRTMSLLPPGKKRTQLTHVDALVGQAGDLLKQMEIEVRSTQHAATKKELTG